MADFILRLDPDTQGAVTTALDLHDGVLQTGQRPRNGANDEGRNRQQQNRCQHRNTEGQSGTALSVLQALLLQLGEAVLAQFDELSQGFLHLGDDNWPIIFQHHLQRLVIVGAVEAINRTEDRRQGLDAFGNLRRQFAFFCGMGNEDRRKRLPVAFDRLARLLQVILGANTR